LEVLCLGLLAHRNMDQEVHQVELVCLLDHKKVTSIRDR